MKALMTTLLLALVLPIMGQHYITPASSRNVYRYDTVTSMLKRLYNNDTSMVLLKPIVHDTVYIERVNFIEIPVPELIPGNTEYLMGNCHRDSMKLLALNAIIDSLSLTNQKLKARGIQNKAQIDAYLPYVKECTEINPIHVSFAGGLTLLFLLLPLLLARKNLMMGALASILLIGSSANLNAQSYRLKTISKDGKDTLVSKRVQVKLEDKDGPKIYIPEIFTPNGDGVNDVFAPQVSNVQYFLLDIYTRWGEYITTINSGETWPGMGVSGTYKYVADWKDLKGLTKQKSGNILELK